jgi:glycosyltransferase involved in cell wall biosynthesis
MHVAFVIDNLGSGGAQRQAAEIAVRLHRDAGVRVSLAFYRRIDFFRARAEEAGVEVHELPKRGPLDPFFAGRLRSWLAAHSPDVVHAFLPAPVFWTALARPRKPEAGGMAAVWIAGERSSPRENLSPAWKRILRWAYARYDAVTANCHPAADVLVSDFGIPADRVHYLPNGIDLATWDRRAAGPAPLTLEPGRFHLALVGRVTEEKNHRLFLEALTRVAPERRRALRVWFVGATDHAPRLVAAIRAEIAERGLSDVVRMVPPTPELPALMARLDALVLPSRYEGFPNVVLEAMASRLPVLASAVGDVPFMIEHGRSGWVVPPGDAAALAEGLSRLLSAPPAGRAAMGAAARAAVESRYRIELVAQQHLDLYRRLADAMRGDARREALG